MATNRSRFEQLLDHFEPRLHNAFLEAIKGIRDRAVLERLVEQLERGDVMGAVEALNIDPEAFGAFDLAIASSSAASPRCDGNNRTTTAVQALRLSKGDSDGSGDAGFLYQRER